jgi:hypothetical protein
LNVTYLFEIESLFVPDNILKLEMGSPQSLNVYRPIYLFANAFYIYTRMRAHTHTHTHAHARARAHTHTHIHVHILDIYMHTHQHTHTYIHDEEKSSLCLYGQYFEIWNGLTAIIEYE